MVCLLLPPPFALSESHLLWSGIAGIVRHCPVDGAGLRFSLAIALQALVPTVPRATPVQHRIVQCHRTIQPIDDRHSAVGNHVVISLPPACHPLRLPPSSASVSVRGQNSSPITKPPPMGHGGGNRKQPCPQHGQGNGYGRSKSETRQIQTALLFDL